MSAHENLNRKDTSSRPTEKNFGHVMSAVFLVVAIGPIFRGHDLNAWALGVSTLLAAITFFRSELLKYPNLAWFKFGMMLHKIVSPVILAILFFGIFTPFGLLIRTFKKDYLGLGFKLKSTAEPNSYWIKSTNEANSMKDQF